MDPNPTRQEVEDLLILYSLQFKLQDGTFVTDEDFELVKKRGLVTRFALIVQAMEQEDYENWTRKL